MLTQALASVFASPLACRIHEGTVLSHRDKRILLLESLGLLVPFYIVAEGYYANGKTVRGLLATVGGVKVSKLKSRRTGDCKAGDQR